MRYKKVFLDENSKTRFSDMKKPKKPPIYKNVLQKKIPEWFSIKIVDPICFIKLLWSISAHWCFQKIIGSGLALWWSDTPQSIASDSIKQF